MSSHRLNSKNNGPDLSIGHLDDDVILLLGPESFWFFLSYLNFAIPVRFE